ncbi:MAG: DUF5127 domain-containing protein, partial [Chitinophagaceae bacterium]
MIKHYLLFALVVLSGSASVAQMPAGNTKDIKNLRAPAYPLITHDPYFSLWSTTTELNASPTKHWTGTDQSIIGILNVDGKQYRFMGQQEKKMETILPAADEKNYEFSYTESAPAGNWMQAAFDDAGWKTGQAPFGDNATMAKTRWTSKDLWVRRTFTPTKKVLTDLFLKIQNDDNTEVYLNGELIYSHKGWTNKYIYPAIKKEIADKIKPGKNVLAIHVANTAGGQWLDAGLVAEVKDSQSGLIKIARQKSVALTATQTKYEFECGAINLNLRFTSPLLMEDLELLSRPVTYVTAQVQSLDGKSHEVEFILSTSTDLATNTPWQEVKAEHYNSSGLSILKAGTTEQPVLKKKGDDLRIDWGYLYVATADGPAVSQSVSENVDFTKSASGSAKTGKRLKLNTRIS